MPEKNNADGIKKVLKIVTAFGTGTILGGVATTFIPGGGIMWAALKGVSYLSSIVLSDVISKKVTDPYIDEEVDSFLEELQDDTEEGA